MSSDEDKTTETKPTPTTPEKIEVDPRSISAMILHTQGVSTQGIASAYGVTVRTVQRWVKELKDTHHDMVFPDVTALKKRLQALAPDAIDVLEHFMKPSSRFLSAPQAMKSAENILKTFNVVIDKVVIVEESAKLTDDELIEQANNLKKGKNV